LPKETLILVWTFSQLLFSLFLTISIYARSVFCFPFLVLGLWKCGCPEIMSYLQKSEISWQHDLYIACISNYFQALATLIHHSSGVFVCVALSVGYWPLTRTVSAVTVPLVMQHLIVLIKYGNVHLYMVLALTLEAFWEWQMWSNMQYIATYNNAIEFAICPMMLAHWLYLTSAGLNLLMDFKHDALLSRMHELAPHEEGEGEDIVDDDGSVSFKRPELKKINSVQGWRVDDFHAHARSIKRLHSDEYSGSARSLSLSPTQSFTDLLVDSKDKDIQGLETRGQ
jgi:hypothetical protein